MVPRWPRPKSGNGMAQNRREQRERRQREESGDEPEFGDQDGGGIISPEVRRGDRGVGCTSIVAFKPDGGEPGRICAGRCLSTSAPALKTRANLLERWLAPGQRADIRGRRRPGCCSGTSISASVSVGDAKEVAAQWASALRDLPGWAVHRTCLRFSQGRVRASELGVERLDPGFAPSTAQVHRIATAIMAAEVAERARLEAVLNGRVTPEAPQRPALAGITAAQAHLVDRDQRAALESDERIKRQTAEAPHVEKRNNDARIEEYRRAGLKPPEPHGGIVVSLPMMLKMGFKIAKVRGETVLVQAPENSRRETNRLLRGRGGWAAEDWDVARSERAGVLEFDEKLPRRKAEELATAQTFNRYGPRPKK